MKKGRIRNSQIGEPPAKARFRWSGAAIWLPASILLGLAIGWFATQVGMRFAPLLIFPLAVGVVLGACLAGVTRLLQTGHRATILMAAVLSVLVAAGSQHYFSYLDARRLIEEDNRRMQQSPSIQKAQAAFAEVMRDRMPEGPLDYLGRQAAMGRPMPFGHVARGQMAWASWLVDGMLVLAGAMTVVLIACRQSFCDRCTSWYRPIRSGRLSLQSARRLAELTDIEIPDESTLPDSEKSFVVHYSMNACRQGCEPTTLLFQCQLPGQAANTTTVWLEAEKKKQVNEIID